MSRSFVKIEKSTTKKIITYIVSFVYFMEAVDSSILNTAIPAMSKGLQVGPVDLKIALISYLLSLAIFIPISGWLSDKYGTKKIFSLSLIIFTISSLWCGFAHNITELIIARFMQGLGGAFGAPVGRLIIVRTFGRHNFIEKMNHVITTAALGIMLGPVLGGIITTHFSWHWIFWVNVPIGLLTLLLTLRYFESSQAHDVHPFDRIGFLLFGTALAGFTFGLSALSESNIDATIAYGIIAMSLVLLIFYIFHAHRRSNPVVKTDLFKIKTFRISVISNLISRLGFGGVPFLLPLLFQIIFGLSAQLSGVLLAPIAMGVLVAKPLSLRLLRYFGYKRTLTVNTLCAASAIFLFATINAHTPLYLVSLLTFVYGSLLALQYSAMNSLAYGNIPSHDISAVTSIMATIQQLAQSFGVAVCAILIRIFSFFCQEHALTLTVFHNTFIVMALLTTTSSFVFLRLKHDDGQDMLQKQEDS